MYQNSLIYEADDYQKVGTEKQAIDQLASPLPKDAGTTNIKTKASRNQSDKISKDNNIPTPSTLISEKKRNLKKNSINAMAKKGDPEHSCNLVQSVYTNKSEENKASNSSFKNSYKNFNPLPPEPDINGEKLDTMNDDEALTSCKDHVRKTPTNKIKHKRKTPKRAKKSRINRQNIASNNTNEFRLRGVRNNNFEKSKADNMEQENPEDDEEDINFSIAMDATMKSNEFLSNNEYHLQSTRSESRSSEDNNQTHFGASKIISEGTLVNDSSHTVVVNTNDCSMSSSTQQNAKTNQSQPKAISIEDILESTHDIVKLLRQLIYSFESKYVEIVEVYLASGYEEEESKINMVFDSHLHDELVQKVIDVYNNKDAENYKRG